MTDVSSYPYGKSEELLAELQRQVENDKAMDPEALEAQNALLNEFLSQLEDTVAKLEHESQDRDSQVEASITSKRHELELLEKRLEQKRNELQLLIATSGQSSNAQQLSVGSQLLLPFPWPTLTDAQNDGLAKQRSLTKTFDFNILSLDADQLMYIVFDILSDFNHLQVFKINPETLRNFIGTVRNAYCSNPYHNWHHACDVTQTVYAFLTYGDGAKYLEAIEVFSLLLGAICHDLEHPGVNNAFLVTTGADLSLLYNDRSVLENHHCAQAFRIFKDPHINVLAGLTPEQFKDVRGCLLTCVLATDMARHSEYMVKLRAFASSRDAIEGREKADRLFLMEILLKSADISNVIKPFSLAQKWAFRVVEEFFQQGDKERLANLPVTPMYDRQKQSPCGMQLGFIDFVCKETFALLAQLLPNLSSCYNSLLRNREQWAQYNDQQFVEASAKYLASNINPLARAQTMVP